MNRKSESLPIIIGVTILSCVALSLSGVAYSFYRTQIAEEREESSDMANDDSPFEQLKKEKNMLISPVPKQFDGYTGIDNNSETEGIPTGTYSNPPASTNPTGGTEYLKTNPSLADLEKFSDRNNSHLNDLSTQKSLTDTSNNSVDYSSPSSSNNFNSTEDNSLIDPLEEENDDFLEPSDSTVAEPSVTNTPPLGESSF